MRFPERLAHPDHLPLVLSADPTPPPKAETLIPETEAKQLRMLATCAGLAAELYRGRCQLIRTDAIMGVNQKVSLSFPLRQPRRDS